MLRPFAASVVPRLALIFFKFMQPLLIKRITEFVDNPEVESSRNNGWGLIGATALVYIGLAVATGAYQHKANRMVTMVRGALVSAIYTQTLDLSITSLDESAAVTLMSSDIERICVALQPIHTLWSGLVEIALAIWLLQREIGIALLGALFVTAIAVSGPFLISKHMGQAQMLWLEKIQTRIDVTAKMLYAIKGVKMLGLSSKMSDIISQFRQNEIVNSLRMRKLFITMIAFGNMASIFTVGASFIIYVIIASINGQTLHVSSAFTALSLIALLVFPIRSIVFTVPPLLAAIGCFDRIEKFITSPIRKDHRMLLPPSQSRPSDIARLDRLSKSQNTGPESGRVILQTKASTSSPVISVKDLTLAWSEGDSPVINHVYCDFRLGDLTMIVGPVGSGKSSLLRGLLGETPSQGNIYISQAHTAFVDQASWIQNCSIRDNIVGVCLFEPEWYAKVVHACAFDTDIEALPEGDRTKAGSAGAALSGGQKLRIVS